MSLTIKNYKKLESWSHNYKEFMIGEVIENQNEYCFRVGYNGLPYTIKIFSQRTIANECEMVLRDGADITQYGREWINVTNLKFPIMTAKLFETFIVKHKPKAQPTTGNTNFNNPF